MHLRDGPYTRADIFHAAALIHHRVRWRASARLREQTGRDDAIRRPALCPRLAYASFWDGGGGGVDSRGVWGSSSTGAPGEEEAQRAAASLSSSPAQNSRPVAERSSVRRQPVPVSGGRRHTLNAAAAEKDLSRSARFSCPLHRLEPLHRELLHLSRSSHRPGQVSGGDQRLSHELHRVF
ncbi:hypothetical protein MRX96_017563 [Rhipicephalus microplus]